MLNISRTFTLENIQSKLANAYTCSTVCQQILKKLKSHFFQLLHLCVNGCAVDNCATTNANFDLNGKRVVLSQLS